MLASLGVNMQTRRGFIGGAALLAGLPCEAQERVYVVYFRWNSAVLRSTMAPRVAAAARTARLSQSERVEVTGYTDTSLSDAESLDMSNRMAKAVANELMWLGVPAEAIVLRGLGEVNLVKDTADGVIEPYNRRVEIVIK